MMARGRATRVRWAAASLVLTAVAGLPVTVTACLAFCSAPTTGGHRHLAHAPEHRLAGAGGRDADRHETHGHGAHAHEETGSSTGAAPAFGVMTGAQSVAADAAVGQARDSAGPVLSGPSGSCHAHWPGRRQVLTTRPTGRDDSASDYRGASSLGRAQAGWLTSRAAPTAADPPSHGTSPPGPVASASVPLPLRI